VCDSRWNLRVIKIALLIAAAAGGGCTKKIWITQIPPFYDRSIQAIAVTPFRNQTGVRGAGNIISDRLAAMLMANGTYKVYNRNDLRTLTDERDLQTALGANPQKLDAMFARLGDVQAILTGVVSTYSATTHNDRRTEPIQKYNKYTKTWYAAGYRSYVWTRNEANVAATAALLRRDGTTIYATPVPAQAQRAVDGSPPKYDPYALLTSATTDVGRQLLEQFAIIRKQIKINPDKALRTASELFEGKWTCSNRFDRTAEKMFVVLALPSSCDRNRFEIKINRKDRREYIVKREIIWNGDKRSLGYPFNPKQIAETGGGPGIYTVKFFSGAEPVFARDFHIY